MITKDDDWRSIQSGKARHVMRTRVLRRPIVFLSVPCSICVRCSILSLLIKTVRCRIVRCSIPHCTEAGRYSVLFPNESDSNFRRVSHERFTGFSKGTPLTCRPFSRTTFPYVAVPHYVLWFSPTSSNLGVLVSALNLHLVTNRRELVTLLFTMQQLKIKSVGPPLR
jgi:hypothetical protein